MIAFWFGVVAAMLSVYVVLDGFDFGAGALHLFVARTDGERRQVLASIGPVWDGNEVWLLAAGGTLFFAFPEAYASGFSGFYLPLMLVLWLLAIRGISIELRSHLDDPLWRAFWDAALCGSSALMAIVLGAALGNILRGVPLDAQGNFLATWFTTFRTRGIVGVLDWYTVLLGVFTLLALMAHGAQFLIWRCEGAVQERARQAARVLWPAVAVAGVLCALATDRLRPELYTSLAQKPVAWPLPVVALGGLAAVFALRKRELAPFLGSSAFLAGTLLATAAGLYPVMLPSTLNPAWSVTATAAAAGEHGLHVGLRWWLVGLPLAVSYTTYLFRTLRGKVSSSQA